MLGTSGLANHPHLRADDDVSLLTYWGLGGRGTSFVIFARFEDCYCTLRSQYHGSTVPPHQGMDQMGLRGSPW